MGRLHAMDRALDVQITTSHSPADFDREEIDIAIYSGEQPPVGCIAIRLFGERLTPVCSPDLLRGRSRALRKPTDLKRHTLLCSLHRPKDWPTWIAAAGVRDIDGNSGLKFENSSLAYQAAIDKLGIAMAQTALVADDLASGRLVAPFDLRVPASGAYFLLYPTRSRELEKVRRFQAWILKECAGMEKLK